MRTRKTAVAAALSAGLLATLLPLTPAHAAPSTPLGVTLYEDGTKLGRFNTARPWAMTAINGAITGLDGDTRLVGIDRRVQNRRLYGVGNRGGIYLMSAERATKVFQLSVVLEGTSFGVDFNPAANALRIVSDEGQNLRQPFPVAGDAPTAPTVDDTALAYPAPAAGTPAPVARIVGAAYTNNDLSVATATTLFDLDTEQEQIAVQAPANAGSLSPTGKLGIAAGVEAGFDIYSEVGDGATTADRATVSNRAFAAIPAGLNFRFHSIDLLTGDATYIGKFPNRVTDFALDLDS